VEVLVEVLAICSGLASALLASARVICLECQLAAGRPWRPQYFPRLSSAEPQNRSTQKTPPRPPPMSPPGRPAFTVLGEAQGPEPEPHLAGRRRYA